ncbi:DUF882 domain-containing protein [Limnobacter humi]|uniref:DUF882 domain-containing protein n=1 Tax=Limnobacter humi TaxID=1778671 RepID=A0ABT1WBY9_9BURK|nr:DUF882 domain-containing protein [Limnobacter humi]MCQ8895025.1 DUF882 domain-containing protein [Limnobacter humi]
MHQMSAPIQSQTRRTLLFGGIMSALPLWGWAATNPLWLDVQRAGERYRMNLLQSDGYKAAAWMLRDVQADNTVGQPDTHLLLRLALLQRWVAEHYGYCVFDITSGLRMPNTNAATEGAAHQSRHLPGPSLRFRAVDFIPRGVDLSKVHTLALHMPQSGVGLYDEHLHLDVRPQSARW